MDSHTKEFHVRLSLVLDPATDPDKVTPTHIEGYLREMLDVGEGLNSPEPYAIVGLTLAHIPDAHSPREAAPHAEEGRGAIHAEAPQARAFHLVQEERGWGIYEEGHPEPVARFSGSRAEEHANALLHVLGRREPHPIMDERFHLDRDLDHPGCFRVVSDHGEDIATNLPFEIAQGLAAAPTMARILGFLPRVIDISND